MSEEKIQDQATDPIQKEVTEEKAQGQEPEVNFSNYITSMVFQTMVFLGEIPNPLTNELDKNIQQAKLLIDTISMIKEKTAGNLSQQESDFINTIVYELQMKFVQQSQNKEEKNDS